MKALPWIVRVLGLVIVLSSLISSWASAQDAGKVTFRDPSTIIIHPGTELSDKDAEALDRVLSQYDKAVYKIETYKNGQLQSTKGNLSDVCVDVAVAAEINDAKSSGRSSRAIQIIGLSGPSRAGQHAIPVIPSGPGTSGSTTPPAPSPSGPGTFGPTTPPAPSPSGPGRPTAPSPSPSGPSRPTVPSPSPSGPGNPAAATGSGNKAEPGRSPSGPGCNPLSDKDTQELIQRLKPILEKYTK